MIGALAALKNDAAPNNISEFEMRNLARIFFAFTATALPYKALAGSVKTVNSKSSTVVIQLDAGEKVKVGDRICFQNDAGKKIDCGNVQKVKGKTAHIKVKNKKNIAKIKSGMNASPEGSMIAQDSGSSSSSSASSSTSSKKESLRLWLLYMPSPMTPAKFQKVAYSMPENATPQSLWRSEESANFSLMGFGAQIGIPFGSISIVPGLRYRVIRGSSIDSNYISSDTGAYVVTDITASAIGLWADAMYTISTTKSLLFNFSGGLDLDRSSVKMTATRKHDDPAKLAELTVAEASSSVMVTSLRLGASSDYIFAKPIGIHLGITLLVPFAEFSKSFSPTIEPTETKGVANPESDLEEQLGHKKSSFGLDINLGATFSF